MKLNTNYEKNINNLGGAGFLGSHLCDRFIKENYQVIAMDNLSTGSIENIEHLFKKSNFEFHEHDVTKFIHVPGPLDYILHFASPASPIDYLKMPIQTMKVGSLGTLNCLGLAKEKKSKNIAGTHPHCSLWMTPWCTPKRKTIGGNVNPIGPRGVYDEAKRFQEALTMAYHTYHQLETRIVRIFNTFGPRMRLNDGRVLPAFIGQALQGKTLTAFGDGSQTRSFTYVDDLIEGIFRLLLSDYAYPVNIGNPQEVTINEFAQEILQLTQSSSTISYQALPEDDPKQRKPDISLAKELLDWSPQFTRSEGLKITVDSFKPKMNPNK